MKYILLLESEIFLNGFFDCFQLCSDIILVVIKKLTSEASASHGCSRIADNPAESAFRYMNG